jgi:putative Holliday junction resolvase
MTNAPSPLPPPHRLLGLDPGERRTGVALSDELGLLAHPRPAIAGSGLDAVETIAALVEREGVGEVVVGLPLRLDGGESAQTNAVRRFAAALQKKLGVPVTVWDERLSSVQASRSVRGRKRTSGELDSAAAAIVLQALLDARARGVRQ